MQTVSAVNQSSYTIRAVYSGDGSFQANQSPDFAQTVNKSPTTTVVTSSLNPSVLGQSVTFTANVSSTSGEPFTTNFGNDLQFFNNGVLIGQGNIDPSGQRTLTLNNLAP